MSKENTINDINRKLKTKKTTLRICYISIFAGIIGAVGFLTGGAIKMAEADFAKREIVDKYRIETNSNIDIMESELVTPEDKIAYEKASTEMANGGTMLAVGGLFTGLAVAGANSGTNNRKEEIKLENQLFLEKLENEPEEKGKSKPTILGHEKNYIN